MKRPLETSRRERAGLRTYATIAAAASTRCSMSGLAAACGSSTKTTIRPGSFKIRGGLNLVGQLEDRERQPGVVSASTGNHGQSLALACRARDPVPHRRARGQQPDKKAAMRALRRRARRVRSRLRRGARVGRRRRAARRLALRPQRQRAAAHRRRRHTAAEIFDDPRRVDFVFVPIGGGQRRRGLRHRSRRSRPVDAHRRRAGAAGRCLRPVVARTARVTRERAETFAEGIATRTTFDLTFSMLKSRLDEVVTLEERELRRLAAAISSPTIWPRAPARPARAARRYGPLPQDATVVCVMSGGNADMSARFTPCF